MLCHNKTFHVKKRQRVKLRYECVCVGLKMSYAEKRESESSLTICPIIANVWVVS